MNFLHKILALATLVVALIMAMLVAANLESIRAIGWHVERFVADLLTITLYCVVVILAWMVREARQECARQQRRAEEAELWLLLADEEIAAARERLANAERSNAHVQALYSWHVRQRLADGWPIVLRNLERRR